MAGWASRNDASAQRRLGLLAGAHRRACGCPGCAFHASNGDACAPIADCHAQIGSMSSALPATTPSSASLWPARPLVAAWSTRSTPWSSGRCTVGPAKVESTTVIGPAMAPTASRSTSDSAGLAGVSTKTTCVLPGSDGGGDGVGVGAVDERDVDAEARQVHHQQAVGDREDLPGGDDVVARRAQAHEHRRDACPCPRRPPAPPRRLRARPRRPRSRAPSGCRSGSRSASSAARRPSRRARPPSSTE